MKKIALLILATVLSTIIYAQESTNDQVIRHLKRAETAYEMQYYQDAIREYEAVIKLQPDYADAYYNLALICEQMQDDQYLQQAIAHYRTYIALVPAEKDAITKKIYELELRAEIKMGEKERFESIIGTWKTTTYDRKTGRPDCIIEITPFEDKLRLKLLPSSKIYSTSFTNIVATAVLYKEQKTQKESVLFTYTDDKNYVPNPAKWDALAIAGSIAGGAIGGIGGDVVTGTTQVGASAGSSADKGKNTRRLYDYKISEIGTDTLKGLLHHYSEERDFRSGNVKILADEVAPVQFIRSAGVYNYPKPPGRVRTTLGFSAVFSFLEDPYYYYNDVGIYSGTNLGRGGAFNIDLLFITKRSQYKNTKLGFSMGYTFLMEKTAYEEYAMGFMRLMIGLAGMSKISNKLYINWGMQPIGLHVGMCRDQYRDIYDEYSDAFYGGDIFNLGICGAADLGLGIQVSKKCTITPHVRCSYLVEFMWNAKVFPFTVQPGIAFNFYDYSRYSNKKM